MFKRLQRKLQSQETWRVYLIYIVVLLTMTALVTAFIFAVEPDIRRNFLNALGMATGVTVPFDIDNNNSAVEIGMVALGISILATLLVLVHVYFQAIVTAKLINPGADIRTSKQAVYNRNWRKGTDEGYITLRLLNWDECDLFDVTIRAVLTVEEQNPDNPTDVMRLYFPVPGKCIDPENTLILPPALPWTIAIDSSMELTNSVCAEYLLEFGKPPVPVCNQPGKVAVTRQIEILINGHKGEAATAFTLHKMIDIDKLDADDNYTMSLVPGNFSGLELEVTDLSQIEHIDIQLAVQEFNWDCGVGAAMSGAILLGDIPQWQALVDSLQPDPSTGTRNSAMAAWALSVCPGGKAGPDSYSGGVAIANITISHTGHYVLFLGRKGHRIRFWCPWTGTVVEALETEINWVSGDLEHKRWAANLTNNSFFDGSERFFPSHKTIYDLRAGTILSWQDYTSMLRGYEELGLDTSRADPAHAT